MAYKIAPVVDPTRGLQRRALRVIISATAANHAIAGQTDQNAAVAPIAVSATVA